MQRDIVEEGSMQLNSNVKKDKDVNEHVMETSDNKYLNKPINSSLCVICNRKKGHKVYRNKKVCEDCLKIIKTM